MASSIDIDSISQALGSLSLDKTTPPPPPSPSPPPPPPAKDQMVTTKRTNRHRRGKKRRGKSKKRGKNLSRRQRGGGVGLGTLLAVGRRAIPMIARTTARLAMHAAKRLPRHLTRAAAQAFIESQLENEIRKRRKNRYSFLGSIRWAATEKMLDQQKWAAKTREGITRREALKRKKLRQNAGAKSGPVPQWRKRIQQAKARQRRQGHLDIAVKRARSRRGLPSLTK
jgi:hypothetical protein